MLSFELDEILELIFREGLILSFLNSLESGVFIVDRNEDIIFINHEAQKRLKKTLSEVKGKKINEIMSFNKMHEILTKGLNYCNVKSTLKKEAVYVNVSTIELNRQIIGAVMVVKETNDYCDHIDTLKLCNSISRELETVFNSACDEIIVTDSQGIIIKISAVYEKLYDMSSQNLSNFLGKNVSQLEDMGMFNPSVILKVIKENKRFSLTQITNSGKVLIVTGYPIYDQNDNLVSVISMAKDITEVHQLRAKLEEAQKTSQKYYYQLEAFKQNEEIEQKFAYKSKKIENIMVTAENVAKVDSNVLITGESGVGKSLFAENIHSMSLRSREKLVSINCGAIPEALLESELFGYEKGAFTGADARGKIGKIDLADKGTLFLDEISELPLPMQVKILKVIQEKRYTRVGGTEIISSDFRLIAATNKNLQELVEKGQFREDLFYRLNVIPVEIPPLRERKEDIIILINMFWEKLNRKYGTNRKLDKEVYDLMLEYCWPGNVRELENCVERIMVTVNKNHIRTEDLPPSLLRNTLNKVEYQGIVSLKKAMEDTEKKLIIDVYKRQKNTYKVAETLGVSQSTIVRKLKKYGYNVVM